MLSFPARAMPILTTEERVGTVLDGKLRLDRVIGEGGMGVVYAGTHLRLDRPVAVKFLAAGLSQSAPSVDRFLREARATSRLSHPNVVDVRDVDVADDGSVYMVLELLEGESLAEHLERRGPLDLEETLAILVPVMDALAAAHAQEIVHRDVKPHNVFLSRDAEGRVVPKVLDFGLARFADVGAGTATQSGAIMGTPLYMAPEQALGNTKAVGPISDIWSTAVMVYECLTNEPPFEVAAEAPVTAIIVAVATGDIIPLAARRPDLPPDVWRVLQRALARKPEDRLASIGELRDGLMRAAGITRVEPLTAPQLAPRTSHAPKPRKIDPMAETVSSPDAPGMKTGPMGPASVSQLPLARRGWLWGVGAAAVLGLAVAVVIAASDPPSVAPPPEPSRARIDSRPPADEPARQELTPPGSDPPAQAPSPPSVEPPHAEIVRTHEPSAERPAPGSAPSTHRPRTAQVAAAAPVEPEPPPAPPPAVPAQAPPPPSVDHRAGSVSLDEF